MFNPWLTRVSIRGADCHKNQHHVKPGTCFDVLLGISWTVRVLNIYDWHGPDQWGNPSIRYGMCLQSVVSAWEFNYHPMSASPSKTPSNNDLDYDPNLVAELRRFTREKDQGIQSSRCWHGLVTWVYEITVQKEKERSISGYTEPCCAFGRAPKTNTIRLLRFLSSFKSLWAIERTAESICFTSRAHWASL